MSYLWMEITQTYSCMVRAKCCRASKRMAFRDTKLCIRTKKDALAKAMLCFGAFMTD